MTDPAPKRIAPKSADRKLIAIKLSPADIAEIDKRAKRAKLTRTDYMVRKTLDKPTGDEDYSERLDALSERLGRLEEVTFGAAR